MDDFVVNVKQIGNYPTTTQVGPGDLILTQQGGLGGPYRAATQDALLIGGRRVVAGLFPPPEANGVLGSYLITPLGRRQGYNFYVDNSGIMRSLQGGVAGMWNFDGAALTFSTNVAAKDQQITLGWQTAMMLSTDGLLDVFQQVRVGRDPALDCEVVTRGFMFRNSVESFMDRTGRVVLTPNDINTAYCLAPGDSLAAQSWVCTAIWEALDWWYNNKNLVWTFNGRIHDVIFLLSDFESAVWDAFNCDGTYPTVPTPPAGDSSNKIADTEFVTSAITALQDWVQQQLIDFENSLDLSQYAPINSPHFTGDPTAPTPPPGDNSGSLATTAFVTNAITNSIAGVASFNGRTGAVVLITQDVISSGALNNTNLTGTPTATTPPVGDDSTAIATTAWVTQEIAALVAGVTSFNGRTGDVTLTLQDIIAAGGATLDSPAFVGTPTTPTAPAGDSSQQIANTQWVNNFVSTHSVVSFNGRTGAITLLANDISAAGGALINSPTFTGTPSGPTAAPGTSNTQLATTAFVQAAITAALVAMNIGVSSFNTRTGAVTLLIGDITAAGGAPLASPAFTGSPTAPTPPAGNNSTRIATTAFVTAAIAAAGGVTSFNGRTGAITLTAADIAGLLPTISGQRVKVADVNGTAQVFYNFTNAYDVYEVYVYDISISGNAANMEGLTLSVSYDGSSWYLGPSPYTFSSIGGLAASGTGYSNIPTLGSNIVNVGQDTSISMAWTGGAAYVSPIAGGEFRIRMLFPWRSAKHYHSWNGSINAVPWIGAGTDNGGMPIQGIRFSSLAGSNVTSIRIVIYGITK